MVFFFRQVSNFQVAIFDKSFSNHSKCIFVGSLKIKSYFTCDLFFVKLWGFKNCHFGHFGTSNARYTSRNQRVSGHLFRLRNVSTLVEGSLYNFIDFLLGAKSLTMYFICVGDDFHKEISTFIIFNITAPQILTGNQNIQGFTLIQAVLFILKLIIIVRLFEIM